MFVPLLFVIGLGLLDTGLVYGDKDGVHINQTVVEQREAVYDFNK